MLFAYFVYITHLTKFASGILSPMEKSLPWKNKKESLGKEKGKEKNRLKEERKNTKERKKKERKERKERIPFCQEKKKILGESDWRPEEVTVKPEFVFHKKRGFFLFIKFLFIESPRIVILKSFKILPKGTHFIDKGIS